jgi:hypothetical protein
MTRTSPDTGSFHPDLYDACAVFVAEMLIRDAQLGSRTNLRVYIGLHGNLQRSASH